MADGKLLDKAALKSLVPANALNAENFQELASKAIIEDIAAGRTLFKAGEVDRKTVYLLEGQVTLTDANGGATTITGGSDVAKHPLANHQPRVQSAKARSDCKITRFDSDLLDILLTWDQLSGIEVNEIRTGGDGSEDVDWMTRILQSRAFLQIPAPKDRKSVV